MGDAALYLNDKINRVRSQLGVRSRQPQGTLVTINWNGADVIDSTDTMDVLAVISERVYVLVEATIYINFREFFAPATAASSGGGSTSGASSASSSDNTDLQVTLAQCPFHGGHAHFESIAVHQHGIAHTHSTPAHGHGLTFGVEKESLPASHDVNLGIYRLDGTTWTLVVSISGLTDDQESLVVSQWVDGPGVWRFSLQSAAGQPNNGRLGVDLAGQAVGAIRSA